MKITYILYSTILTIIFLSGIDTSLLYQRAFIGTGRYTQLDYAHFVFTVFAGWLVGFFIIKKIVNKYTTNYILKTSLLMASIVTWAQYKAMHHAFDKPLFSQTMIDNVYVSIILGFITYSLVRIYNEKNDLSIIKKNKIFFTTMFILGIIYSSNFNEKTIQIGFLISSIIYFFAYIILSFFNVERINKVSLKNIYLPLMITFALIILLNHVANLKFINSIKIYSEEQYPIYIFILLLLYEATESKKEKNKLNKNIKY